MCKGQCHCILSRVAVFLCPNQNTFIVGLKLINCRSLTKISFPERFFDLFDSFSHSKSPIDYLLNGRCVSVYVCFVCVLASILVCRLNYTFIYCTVWEKDSSMMVKFPNGWSKQNTERDGECLSFSAHLQPRLSSLLAHIRVCKKDKFVAAFRLDEKKKSFVNY